MTSPDQHGSLFICIVLTEATAQATLFSIGGEKGETIVSSSTVLQYKDEKEAVVKVDQCLQDLGKASEHINDVIFALPQQWVTVEGIVDEKKPLLKNLTEDLGLHPVGFVVITEVLLQSLPQQTSQLLLIMSHSSLSVSYVHHSDIQFTESVGRSADPIADAQEGFARLLQSQAKVMKHLPAQLLITSISLSEDELNTIQQAMFDVNWVETGLFVSPPLINVVAPQTVVSSLISQAAKAVAQAKGLTLPSPQTEPSSAQEFGFQELNPADSPAVETAVQSSKGIPITSIALPQSMEETAVEMDETPPTATKKRRLFSFHLKTRKLPFIVGGFGAGLVVLLILGYFGLQSIATAHVTVTLKTQSIANEAQITLDPQAAASNPEQNILKAKLVTKKIIGDKSIDTSGVKLVGEMAKGKVTLINKTDSEKKFSKGATLKSEKLIFTLDEDVTVASASVSTTSSNETKTFGKAEGTATATVIGADYNLAKNTELQIGDFSSSTYIATVTDGFSGGSSREIRVVAPEDRKKILSDLELELSKKAEKEFEQASGNGNYQLPTGRKKTIEAEYSAKEGDETKTLSLALELEVEGVEYIFEDLRPLAEEILKDKIPVGYVLTQDPPTILSRPDAASNSAKVVLDANITAKAKPNFQSDTIKDTIKGKPLNQALTDLRAKPEISDAVLRIEPGIIAPLVKRVPPTANRIQVEIK